MGQQGEQEVYEISLAGLSLKLKSSHDQETVTQLVDYVNNELAEAMPRTKSGSLQTAALLACLNIADELMTLKLRANKELDRFEKSVHRTLTRLESSRRPTTEADQ
jgi:cell division protein ZapA